MLDFKRDLLKTRVESLIPLSRMTPHIYIYIYIYISLDIYLLLCLLVALATHGDGFLGLLFFLT